MIYEIASLTIDPARATAFESAVAQARSHFEAAKGFISFCLQRVIEEPGAYRLVSAGKRFRRTWLTSARPKVFSTGAPLPDPSSRPRLSSFMLKW